MSPLFFAFCFRRLLLQPIVEKRKTRRINNWGNPGRHSGVILETTNGEFSIFFDLEGGLIQDQVRLNKLIRKLTIC